MKLLFFLLVIYQIKHFVADFPLQGKYMLKKFLPDWGFFLPLLAHVSVHGAFTLLIASLTKPQLAVKLALFDMIVHFTMDRIKASPKYLGRYKPLTAKDYPTSSDAEKTSNTYFWWSLGLDQGVHHLTHYIIIYFLVTS
jgi:hypothetical protein